LSSSQEVILQGTKKELEKATETKHVMNLL